MELILPVNKVNKYANLHLNNCGGSFTHDDIFLTYSYLKRMKFSSFEDIQEKGYDKESTMLTKQWNWSPVQSVQHHSYAIVQICYFTLLHTTHWGHSKL